MHIPKCQQRRPGACIHAFIRVVTCTAQRHGLQSPHDSLAEWSKALARQSARAWVRTPQLSHLSSHLHQANVPSIDVPAALCLLWSRAWLLVSAFWTGPIRIRIASLTRWVGRTHEDTKGESGARRAAKCCVSRSAMYLNAMPHRNPIAKACRR